MARRRAGQVSGSYRLPVEPCPGSVWRVRIEAHCASITYMIGHYAAEGQ